MSAHPFDQLTPEFICDAIDSQGLRSDARLTALNSFENRVYQVGIEDSDPLIAKFYRPQRWSLDQIKEEHEFTAELLEAELDVIAPIAVAGGETLYEYQGFYIALFPRFGGSPPDIEQEQNLEVLGRLLGRMHAVARSSTFQYRPTIRCESYAEQSIELLLQHWVPGDLHASYQSIAHDVLALLRELEASAAHLRPLRSHGDFHLGNMIHRDQRIHMLDFDDTRTAHAIQDIWMLLSGEQEDMDRQLDVLIRNYELFHDFDWREVHLVEYYRTLRILHHSAWIASRWEDPAFPLAFPWFNTGGYWSQQILTLREQLYSLQQSHTAMSGNYSNGNLTDAYD